MPAFNAHIDVQISVTEITIDDRLIGSASPYATTAHPITGKTIDGWIWDKAVWPKAGSLDSYAIAPTLWDNELSGLSENYFQSGIGHGNDLLVTEIQTVLNGTPSGVVDQNIPEIWAPKIYHGNYFVFDEPWYLYSDSYQSEVMSGVYDGHRSQTLKYKPKVGIPIRVCTYWFDNNIQRYRLARNFRHQLTLNDIEDPEFWIDSTYSPPTIVVNGMWEDIVGQSLTLDPSGFLSPPEDIFELEELGISNGYTSMEFSTLYSPHDPNVITEIWTYLDPSRPTKWTVIPPLQGWQYPPDNQVKVDPDTGLVRFGDGTTGGNIPPKGSRIMAYYGKGIVISYEPEHTTDYLLPYRANTNPVEAGSEKGFVQVTTSFAGPAQIVLDSDLEYIEMSYQLGLGNNTGRIRATVYDSNGVPMDGQSVDFNVLSPQVGTFGGVTRSAIASTNIAGEAYVVYNSPLTIRDVGQATVDMEFNGGNTILTVSGITDPGTVSGLYVYKVHVSDDVMGLPLDQLDEYYANYFVEETISGFTASQDWEEDYRLYNEFMTPTTYTTAELGIGKKTILLSSNDPMVIDPHTGHRRSSPPYPYAPLHPSLYENIGTQAMPVAKLTFNSLSLPDIGVNNTKSYFVVGDAKTRIQASTVNRRTGTTVYSNIISLKVTIPPTVNGTYFAEMLNEIPSGLMSNVQNVDLLTDEQINETSGLDGFWVDYTEEHLLTESYKDWFKRTRRGDTLGLTTAGYGLQFLMASGSDIPGVIPMGFRLKSAGITLASMLDQITYIDPNDFLPSGYWPDEWHVE